jgi:FecR protein
MKNKFLIVAALIGLSARLSAAPLTESTFTEVIKDVNTVSTAGNATPAKVNEVVKAPDRVRTGPESRAELTAPDKTITRVGANTVFSFNGSGREIDLEEGSLLFHSPKGAGGGVIKSGGASAAVLGTTIIVEATKEGEFRLTVLEGTAKAQMDDGKSKTVRTGQTVSLKPGGKAFSSALTFNLGKLVASSELVDGFSHELPSLGLINAAIDRQNRLMAGRPGWDTAIPQVGVPGRPASGQAGAAGNPGSNIRGGGGNVPGKP